MNGTKVCNKCGKKNLGWDYDFNKNTGKWKLENHKRIDGKWCNKPKEENKFKIAKKQDYVKCELCLGNTGWCLTEESHERNPLWNHVSLEKHTEMFHPNNEVLTDEDFVLR